MPLLQRATQLEITPEFISKVYSVDGLAVNQYPLIYALFPLPGLPLRRQSGLAFGKFNRDPPVYLPQFTGVSLLVPIPYLTLQAPRSEFLITQQARADSGAAMRTAPITGDFRGFQSNCCSRGCTGGENP